MSLPLVSPPVTRRPSELPIPPGSPGARESTRALWFESVENAVAVMRERMPDPLALETLARSALMSPYHFNRVFRLVTGIPPGRFLTALRMAEAKRLLLSTSQRVTDVCFAVGFESLGTFTTRFGQLVGVAPQELRKLAEEHGDRSLASLGDPDGAPREGVSGFVDGPGGSSCVAIVGLFDRPAPQGLPVGCDIIPRAPGRFRIHVVPTGRYYPLAIGFPHAETVLDATRLDPRELLVSALPERLSISADQRQGGIRLQMRSPGYVDPPIVLAAPLLAARAQPRRDRRRSAAVVPLAC